MAEAREWEAASGGEGGWSRYGRPGTTEEDREAAAEAADAAESASAKKVQAPPPPPSTNRSFSPLSAVAPLAVLPCALSPFCPAFGPLTSEGFDSVQSGL